MLRSEITPFLIAHMSGGAIGVIAGLTALLSRKGSRVHRAAGAVFTAAMVVGGSSAAWLGYHADPQDMGDVVAGAITIYFVTTAYAAARRGDDRTGLFEIVAFLIAAGGGVGSYLDTSRQVAEGTALLNGVPGYIFAAVASFAALLDLSVILRRGIAGRQRIARHLWRMLIGFIIAVGSFFPGQLHLFPEWVRDIKPTVLLFLPAFSIVGVMILWLVRVLATRWWDAGSAAMTGRQ